MVEIVKKAAEDLKLVLPKVPDMVKEADTIGAQAAKEGKKKPGQCIEYNKKEKRTPAELAALKKAKEEKDKKKKGKKKGDKKGEKKGEHKEEKKEEHH